jgi:hypothetical protein
MEAFYAGHDTLQTKDWDFIVKLDGDVGFAPDYFEKCLDKFEIKPRLGIGGGLIHNKMNDDYIVERDPKFHVRGATKIYKRECWEAINGLIRAPGWDTVDEVKANMLGWETTTFRDLAVIHYRFTGSAYGEWADYVKNGTGSYIVGYHPLFMLARSLNRAWSKPYFKESAGLMWGYLRGYMRGVQQLEDKKVIKYLRKQQVNRLLMKDSIWR